MVRARTETERRAEHECRGSAAIPAFTVREMYPLVAKAQVRMLAEG